MWGDALAAAAATAAATDADLGAPHESAEHSAQTQAGEESV